jgi:hypothetical protein
MDFAADGSLSLDEVALDCSFAAGRRGAHPSYGLDAAGRRHRRRARHRHPRSRASAAARATACSSGRERAHPRGRRRILLEGDIAGPRPAW